VDAEVKVLLGDLQFLVLWLVALVVVSFHLLCQ
jgi:hypothetical protein